MDVCPATRCAHRQLLNFVVIVERPYETPFPPFCQKQSALTRAAKRVKKWMVHGGLPAAPSGWGSLSPAHRQLLSKRNEHKRQTLKNGDLSRVRGQGLHSRRPPPTLD